MGEGTDGTLSASDATLSSGEYVDRYPVSLSAGDRLHVELASSEFDTYVYARSPSGGSLDNDDCTPGDTALSCLDIVAPVTEQWTLYVTSYEPGETGRYRLTTDEVAAGEQAGGVRVESGALAAGDDTLSSGEYADAYTFEGTGGPVVVDLRSSEFDTYLIIVWDGDQLDNDDHEGSTDRSLLTVATEAGRSYRVRVTSYQPGETGRYDLAIRTGDADNSFADGIRTEGGTLASGDRTLRSGEYLDSYTFEGVPGQRVRIDLSSSDFDTYLIVKPPSGENVDNDDAEGLGSNSRVDLDLAEPGTYTVLVTSYQPGETGAYDLRMDFSERFGQPALPDVAIGGPGTDNTGENAGSAAYWQPVARRIADWTLAEDIAGDLDPQDRRAASGKYQELHTFDGDAGEPIRVEMRSADFDTFLAVVTPSGEALTNDDFEGDQTRSVVEFVMPEAGRYQIVATSYRADATGDYTLRLSQRDAFPPTPPAFDRIVGVFMGISDYPGEGGDLMWTDQDAERAREAMISVGMAPEDGILLTDADATTGNFRAAVSDLAARTDARTLFVMFYSGHGGQQARTEFQRADPDGLDETLALYDGALLDDELDVILNELPAENQLIVFDACFSGGFSKDIITRPGRMGMFSSEEDVVSQVAAKFEAGGYLSTFFAEGVRDHHADEDGNGAISALELSQYIYERYRGDVQDARAIIQARDVRLMHQKLVVDRGSVGLYDTLFLTGR